MITLFNLFSSTNVTVTVCSLSAMHSVILRMLHLYHAAAFHRSIAGNILYSHKCDRRIVSDPMEDFQDKKWKGFPFTHGLCKQGENKLYLNNFEAGTTKHCKSLQ